MGLEARRGAVKVSNNDLMDEQQYVNSSFNEFENSTRIPQFKRSSGEVEHHKISNGDIRKNMKLVNAEQIVVRKSIPAHYIKLKKKPITAFNSTSSFGKFFSYHI